MRVIHCKTKEQFTKVQEKFFSQGIYWEFGKKEIKNYWNEYEEKICIALKDSK